MKTAADSYLEQRVLGSTPEQQAALIMEAGQLAISKAIRAINDKHYLNMAKHLSRVGEVILEAEGRLNPDGGEVVQNLHRVYHWWTNEILEAAHTRDVDRLSAVAKHMGTIRQGWEELATKLLKERFSSPIA